MRKEFEKEQTFVYVYANNFSYCSWGSQGKNTEVICHSCIQCVQSITTNKASGSDGIPVELFQILKDDAVKVLHSICQQIWKTQQWPQDWKMSVFIPIPKKGNAKEYSNYRTIALILHASKVMLKILQASLQQYMICELPDVQAGFRKGRGTRDQIAGSWKNQESSRKTSISVLLTMLKPLTVWITTKAQRQTYRSMEQNRKPRDKSTHIWTPYL